MKIKPWLLTLKEEERSLTSKKKLIKSLNPKTNSYIKNLNQGDSRSFRKDKEKREISHLTNATIVTRWGILRDIV
jgi:hypothetical protein